MIYNTGVSACVPAKRIEYFDYLRVFATFSVMILHISAQNWYTTDVNGIEWQVFNFFDSIVRWGVPVFVMLSGALFLNREITIRKLFSKYILRLVISYVVWSAIYALFSNGDAKVRFSNLILGHYHMWFIPMTVGTYICIPFIKSIIENEKNVKYYLVLSFVFAFFIPELFRLSCDFAGKIITWGVSAVSKYANIMNVNIVLGYTGYFILGYYLNKVDLGKEQRIIVYVLGLLGFISTIYLDLMAALKTQKCSGNYYGDFNVNVLLESIAVFTWFKYKNASGSRIILKLSKFSFGAYLVHALVIEQLDALLGLNTLSFNPIFAVSVISIIVFIISYLISAILNQIPILKKYIV